MDRKNQHKEPGWDRTDRDMLWKKVGGYGDLFIFVPEMKQVIRISEGTGDNLLWEDKEKGYVDYLL